jgi:hypothetical protein
VAEIRSFIIGVVAAGVAVGILFLALGAFSGEGEESPTARLLPGSTPPASPTVRATQRPATTALPTVAATRAVTPTAEATSPATSPTAQATATATNTPAPQPTANPVAAYTSAASVYVTDLGAQIDYVTGQGTANPSGSKTSAAIIKEKAGAILALSAPACLSSAHGTLTQGANAARIAADQLVVALDANNAAAVSTAISNLNSAKATLGQGAAAISAANC